MPVDFSTGDKGREVCGFLQARLEERVAVTEPTPESGSSSSRDVPRRAGHNNQGAWKRGAENVPLPGHEAAWVEKEYELAPLIAFAVEAFRYHGYPDWEVWDHAGDKEGRTAFSTAPWTGEPEASCAGGRLEAEGQA